MIIIKDLNTKVNFLCNITIGVFDGLHLGHQKILKKLKEKKGKSVVVTFQNHPLEILKPQIDLIPIYTVEEKLKLLKSFGIDIVVMLKFTKKFANISYIDFISSLKRCFSFNNLVVGDDVKIGRDQLGNINSIKKLQNSYNFEAEFIKKIKYQNTIISSGWIRSLIVEKKYDIVNILLNRVYENKEI